MKKLHRKGKVHPSPPQPPTIAHYFSLLPAALLSLTAELTFRDKEVLAYLISCFNGSSATSGNNFRGHLETPSKTRIDLGCDNKEHDPTFECNCFRCYTCFWARWDSSPNRQLIHEIIEAYEEGLFEEKKQVKKNKKGRRNRASIHDSSKHGNDQESSRNGSINLNDQKLEYAEMNCQSDEAREVESERGSIRNIVSFIGYIVWGVLIEFAFSFFHFNFH